MNDRALVFAGGSFLGRHVCEALRRAGKQVVWTSRRRLAGAALCDVTDREQIERLTAKVRPAYVVQCSGATTTTDPAAMFDVHVRGSLNVLEAVSRHAPHAAILLFGSAAEYGTVEPHALPVDENHPTAPRSFFGASKLAQTELARAAAAERRLRVTVVRPFNVVGPGLPPHYFAAALARRLRDLARTSAREFPVSNLTATRDFVDVRDVVAAAVALLARSAAQSSTFDVYNAASGIETPLYAVAARLGELAGGLTPIDGGGAASRSSLARSCGDAAKLRRDVGWSPQRSWRESIDDLWSCPADGLGPGEAASGGRTAA
jgi:GDP-4-dehydro-6-deoxy-D-mannose reductase